MSSCLLCTITSPLSLSHISHCITITSPLSLSHISHCITITSPLSIVTHISGIVLPLHHPSSQQLLCNHLLTITSHCIAITMSTSTQPMLCCVEPYHLMFTTSIPPSLPPLYITTLATHFQHEMKACLVTYIPTGGWETIWLYLPR